MGKKQMEKEGEGMFPDYFEEGNYMVMSGESWTGMECAGTYREGDELPTQAIGCGSVKEFYKELKLDGRFADDAGTDGKKNVRVVRESMLFRKDGHGKNAHHCSERQTISVTEYEPTKFVNGWRKKAVAIDANMKERIPDNFRTYIGIILFLQGYENVDVDAAAAVCRAAIIQNEGYSGGRISVVLDKLTMLYIKEAIGHSKYDGCEWLKELEKSNLIFLHPHTEGFITGENFMIPDCYIINPTFAESAIYPFVFICSSWWDVSKWKLEVDLAGNNWKADIMFRRDESGICDCCGRCAEYERNFGSGSKSDGEPEYSQAEGIDFISNGKGDSFMAVPDGIDDDLPFH